MRKTDQQYRTYSSEQCVLGTVLLNESAYGDVVQILGTSDVMFSDAFHRSVWNGMVKLATSGIPIDFMTLCDVCRDQNQVAIAELTNSVPTSANCEHYAEMVRDAYAARKLSVQARSIIKDFEDDSLTLDRMEGHRICINDILQRRSSNRMESISEILPRVIADIEKFRNDPLSNPVIRTGISQLDDMLGCLRPGTLNIIGARPGVGKSALSANIAINAGRSGHPVIFFSLEMGGDSIVKRLMSIDQGIPYKTLAGEFCRDIQRKRVEVTKDNFQKLKFFINDSGSLEINKFKADSRRFASQHTGMPLIILDYLQLVKVDVGRKNANRYEQIGDFTREAKILAKELNCPIILLCQLSREADDKDDPFVCMPYMRESGNIENDADTVIVMLKRLYPALAAIVSGEQKKDGKKIPGCVARDLVGNVVNSAVIKNRDGETGACALYFDKPTQRIVSLADFIQGNLNRDYDPPKDPTYNPLPEYDYEEDDTPF